MRLYARSDNCCDPSKYESCSLQAEGADPDVKIKTYQCNVVGPQSSIETSCEVEPGWTVIGGGAQILDAASDEVNLARSAPEPVYSAPEDDLKGARVWRLGSTSIDGHRHAHRLRPFAIGIKLKGYDNVTNFAPLHAAWGGVDHGGLGEAERGREGAARRYLVGRGLHGPHQLPTLWAAPGRRRRACGGRLERNLARQRI